MHQKQYFDVFLYKIFVSASECKNNISIHQLNVKITLDGVCLLCHDGMATANQYLIFCQLVKCIWKKNLFFGNIYGNYIWYLFWIVSVYCRCIFGGYVGVICDDGLGYLEEYCNICISDSKQKRRLDIKWVFRYFETFQKSARMFNVVKLVENREVTCRWIAPTQNHFRVDVDACYDEMRNGFSIVVVIRDSQEKLLRAMARVI